MADLGGIATSNGNGTSRPRPAQAQAQSGSPSGIRGPRMIMQERAAREAARQQRAEQEQLERQRIEQEQLRLSRSRAEQDARLLEEAQRRNAERRAAAAAAGGARGQEGSEMPAPLQSPRRQQEPQPTTPEARPAAGTFRIPPTSQAQPRPPQRTTAGTYTTEPAAAGPSQQAGTSTTAGAKPRTSFPHAFERWETLSAQWEGLTSHWIKRLELNSNSLEGDPLSQQLSRQVTDLSAAGANLFHAVVELQRLRASSERKFQRWFFETRAELERAQEVNAMLETALEEERARLADAMSRTHERDSSSSIIQTQLSEMKKELSISKEEARRAWEELGRREQEERERTVSLQSGQPTIVGGVQVVPMTQGVPSRHGSTREQRYDGGGYSHGEYTQPPAVQPADSSAAGGRGALYRPTEAAHHHERSGSYTGAGSEGGYSEGEYAIDSHGNFIRDAQGNRMPFPPGGSPVSRPDDDAEEYETPATHPGGGYTSAPAGTYPTEEDYSGQGYGAPGWETVPRHHHPTRLSDVLEEEESRTSASQVSRG